MKNIRRDRVIYLAFFCLINLFAGTLYAWSVLAGPLAQKVTELGGAPVSAADLGFIFSLASLVNPFAMILGGWVNDRFGPRVVVPAGGLLIGAGLISSSFATSVAALQISYGLVYGFGVGLVYTATMGSAIKYFPDHQGLAGGLSSMSYGFSSILLPPIAGYLIASFGISQTLFLMGCAAGGVIAVVGLFCRRCPDDISGELAFGKKPTPSSAVSQHRSGAAVDRNWRQMLASPMFWAMLVFFIAGSTGAMMMISGVSSIAVEQAGMSIEATALLVSFLAVMNAVGRLAAGTLSDKLGRIPSLFICLGCAAAGLLVLLISGTGEVVRFCCGAGLVVLCYGGYVGIYPGFTVDHFGARYNSVNYGIMAAGFSLGGLIGPWILRIFSDGADFSSAYWGALVVCGIGAAAGLCCIKLQGRSAAASALAQPERAL